jgi:cyclase
MHTQDSCPSRRDFLASLFAGVLAARIIGVARHRSEWVQQLSSSATPGQFEIQKVADDVYFALAQPWAVSNSNAAIFVNSAGVVVVDAQSHPAAATALIEQIKKEVTAKPVRWLVNTHFHWDHTQGNRAYVTSGSNVDIVASNTTKQLMSQLLVPRLRAALDPASPGPRGSQQVARQLEDLRQRLSTAASEAKGPLLERIAQVESFAAEMKAFEPTLPTITFDRSYVIREKECDLRLEFHGYGHTAGDIVVYCPRKRVIVTGDAHHPGFPGFIDSYPQLWPKAIDSIMSLQFDHILPGHGRMQYDRRNLTGRRDFIEELTERVLAGRRAGQSVADLQRTVTAMSLKSLQAGLKSGTFVPASTPDAIERGIRDSIDNMYDRVEKVSFTGTEPVRLRGENGA